MVQALRKGAPPLLSLRTSKDATGQLAANFSPSGAGPALDYVVSEEG